MGYTPTAPEELVHNERNPLATRLHATGGRTARTTIQHLIRPLPPAEVSDVVDANGSTVVSLRVPNRFKLDWIRAQYAARISALLEKVSGQKVPLELALAPREAYTKSSSLIRSFEGVGVMEPAALGVPEELAGAPFKNRLNTALTFDTLIEGTANRMGRAAAMHVASSLGQLYNPLFIYGGVGLG